MSSRSRRAASPPPQPHDAILDAQQGVHQLVVLQLLLFQLPAHLLQVLLQHAFEQEQLLVLHQGHDGLKGDAEAVQLLDQQQVSQLPLAVIAVVVVFIPDLRAKNTAFVIGPQLMGRDVAHLGDAADGIQLFSFFHGDPVLFHFPGRGPGEGRYRFRLRGRRAGAYRS